MKNSKESLWSRDFILIILINLLVFISWHLLMPTLPLYAKALGGAEASLGWLVGTATIASLVIRPFSGILLDTIGRKTVLIPGLLILLVVAYFLPWLSLVWALIAIRFIHGLGWGMASTASSTIASDNIPRSRFGEGMGYFSLSSSISMAVAPGIALAVFYARDFKTVAMLSTGLVFLVLLLTFFVSTKPVVKPEVMGEGKAPRKALYEISSILPSTVMFLISSTYGSITGFMTLYADSMGIQDIGIFFSVYAVTLLVSRPMLGKITDKHGYNATVYPGFLLVLVTMLILSQAANITWFLVAAFVYGIGLGAVLASLQTMAIARAPKDRLGAANATFFTGFDGGIGFGAILGGVVATYIGYNGMYMTYSLFAIIAAITYYAFFMRKKKVKTAESSLEG